MPLEAPCQDTPDLPFANFEMAHKDVIEVAQNSIIKYKTFQNFRTNTTFHKKMFQFFRTDTTWR